jgi:hypothetical protein
MIRFLSSMKFAFWSILALILWFFAGVAFASQGEYKKAFAKMNDLLILDWFFSESFNNIPVLLWFSGLCISGGIVLISFVFCTWTTLRKPLTLKKNRLKSWLMFSLHIVFILIVLFHVLSMIMGFKYGYQKAFDQTILEFDNGYAVHVHEIQFVNDTEVLKSKESHSKIRLSKENFSIDENYVDISLFKENEFLARGKTFFLKPFVFNNIHITIENFFVDNKNDNEKIGVRLVVARNPVHVPFFIMYAVAIVLILFWTVLTWKESYLNG